MSMSLDDDNAYRRYLRTDEERESYKEAVGGYVLVPNGYHVDRFDFPVYGEKYITGWRGRHYETNAHAPFKEKRFILKPGAKGGWICLRKSKSATK